MIAWGINQNLKGLYHDPRQERNQWIFYGRVIFKGVGKKSADFEGWVPGISQHLKGLCHDPLQTRNQRIMRTGYKFTMKGTLAIQGRKKIS